MPNKSSNSSRSSGSASGTRARTRARAAGVVEIAHAGGRAQQPRHHVKGDVAGVRFAEGGEHLDTAACGQRGDFTHQAGFADARWSRPW